MASAEMLEAEARKLGSDSRERAAKCLNRAVLFGALLILSHLLTIKPSEIEAAGLKIAVEDPAIIRGSMSLAFWFYFVNCCIYYLEAAFLQPFSKGMRAKRAYMRSVAAAPLIFLPEKMTRSREEVKRSAKRWVRFYDGITGGYSVVLGVLIAGAAAIAAYDTACLFLFVFHAI